MEKQLKKISIKISDDHLYDDATELIMKIRPEWSRNKLSFKLFTDGITNRLIGCYLNDNDNGNDNDIILIRIYGKNTDLFIDRMNEFNNMNIMFTNGLSAPIYCQFLNGICYGYTPGNVLNENLIYNLNISKLIAEKLAHMHTLKSINLNNNDNDYIKPCLFIDLNKFLSLVNNSALESLNSPIVLFIDFEYSNYNYQAFDIANHFCEFCGIDQFDYNKYPDKKFQLNWLKIYLKKFYTLNNNNNNNNNDELLIDNNVQILYNQVKKFALASCLYWGIWALVQISNSSIDFDYITFACQRLDEYYRRKCQLINNK